MLANLEHHRERNQTSVNNAYELSIEAIEEADLCVDVGRRACSVAFVARAVFAVGIAIESAVSWYYGVAVEDISEERL